MSFLNHQDYVMQSRAQDIYKALLDSLNQFRVDRRVWVALPGEINHWWRERSERWRPACFLQACLGVSAVLTGLKLV